MSSPAVVGPPGFRHMLDARFTKPASFVQACLTAAGGLTFAIGLWNLAELIRYRLVR